MKKRKRLLLASLVGVIGIVLGSLLYQGLLPFRTLSHGGQIWQMRFSPDGRFLAAPKREGGLSIWNTHTWKLTQTIPGVFDAYYFLPDSRTLIAERSYSSGTGPLADKINHGEGLTMAESKQENATMRYLLQRWDVVTGQATQTVVLTQSAIESAAPKANRVILRRFAPTAGISVRDTRDGHEVHFLPTAPTVSASVSPDSRWLAFVDFSKPHGAAQVWDTETWQPKTLQSSPGPNSADFSPDSKLLEVSSARDVTVWRVSDWKQVATFPTNYDDAGRSQFTPDSKQIVADGSWRNRQQNLPNTALMIWNVATGRRIATLKHQYLVDWRLNSRGLATLDMISIHNILWNTKTGQRIWEGYGGYFPETAVSPDGHTLLTAHLNSSNANDGGVIEMRHLP